MHDCTIVFVNYFAVTVLLEYRDKLQMLNFFSKANPAPFMLECNIQPVVSQVLLA